MNNLFNLKSVAAAAGMAAALIGAAPAQAQTVYAMSHLDVSNLTLTTTSGSATVNSFQFDITNTATLNGNSAPISQATCGGAPFSNSCSGVSPVLDAGPANAPGGAPVRANNFFGFFGSGGGATYSNSDSVITTAAVVQGLPTSTQQIAESLLTGSGTASASTNVQSNTTLQFQITIGSGGANLALNFSADPDMEAAIASVAGGSYNAQANMTASFQLTGDDGFLQWSPRGTTFNAGTGAGNDCITTFVGVTCTESADSQNLQTTLATGQNNTDRLFSYDPLQTLTAFGINIAGLAAGNYSLSLVATTSTQIRQTIPEPGTTALVGLALAGLAVTGRRGRSLFNRKA